ncbi:hypothetical protein E4U42_005274 [Claviceps africana]|uniref:Cytochrome P450 monooxygenase n=1 Tax=Claviceps africana TaxID=83212 RepID=A0A8K0NM85_9HYPO|nr:hypothetical protein E4U42_005274 [Claviceps africana]
MAYATKAVIAVVTICVLYYVRSFVRNIIDGWATGLPMMVIPADHTSPFWRLWAPRHRHHLQMFFPRQIWDRINLTIFGWEFGEKLRPFEKLAKHHRNLPQRQAGFSFTLVGLGRLEIYTADPVAAHNVLSRHCDFQMPKAFQYALAQSGLNVLTANEDLWTRHRRIISCVMSDHISKSVFGEAIKQTRQMLDDLERSSLLDRLPDKDSLETRDLSGMLKKVTMHTILRVGMNIPVAWKDDDEKAREPGYKMTHVDALLTAMKNISGAHLLPAGLLNKWPRWMPGHGKMASVGCAKLELARRNRVTLEREQRSRVGGEDMSCSRGENFVKSFLKTNEELTRSGVPLSEAELLSNIFILSVGGYETTAAVLSYATVLLARFPDWQAWVLEEVDELTTADDYDEQDMEKTWAYSSTFPCAVRILAFMLETMRLYTPVCHLRRDTVSPQILQTAQGAVPVPADATIYVNAVAIHLLPVWRDINRASDPAFYRDADAPARGEKDEYAFRPSRWLNPPGKGQGGIYIPPRGTFVAWSGGPRVCPGKKLSQVEFTAVILTLLQRYRIEAVPLGEEGRAELEERLDATLRNSRCEAVLQMDQVWDVQDKCGLLMRLRRRK